MIRAGVDDRQMARAVGIPVANLFTTVFCLGAGIAGAAGVLGGPILSAYPGLDADMLPLALIVVILGGIGSLPGAVIGGLLLGVYCARCEDCSAGDGGGHSRDDGALEVCQWVARR